MKRIGLILENIALCIVTMCIVFSVTATGKRFNDVILFSTFDFLIVFIWPIVLTVLISILLKGSSLLQKLYYFFGYWASVIIFLGLTSIDQSTNSNASNFTLIEVLLIVLLPAFVILSIINTDRIVAFILMIKNGIIKKIRDRKLGNKSKICENTVKQKDDTISIEGNNNESFSSSSEIEKNDDQIMASPQKENNFESENNNVTAITSSYDSCPYVVAESEKETENKPDDAILANTNGDENSIERREISRKQVAYNEIAACALNGVDSLNTTATFSQFISVTNYVLGKIEEAKQYTLKNEGIDSRNLDLIKRLFDTKYQETIQSIIEDEEEKCIAYMDECSILQDDKRRAYCEKFLVGIEKCFAQGVVSEDNRLFAKGAFCRIARSAQCSVIMDDQYYLRRVVAVRNSDRILYEYEISKAGLYARKTYNSDDADSFETNKNEAVACLEKAIGIKENAGLVMKEKDSPEYLLDYFNDAQRNCYCKLQKKNGKGPLSIDKGGELEESVQIEEIDRIDKMDGQEFEKYCLELLLENGYEKVTTTKASGDQGVDIIAQKDGIKYAIQCKCYSSDVGNQAVQEARSGMSYYDCNVAIVLTNRYFTTGAKKLATKNAVVLWDRDMLSKMIENKNSRKNII